jgi:hypothetical protein
MSLLGREEITADPAKFPLCPSLAYHPTLSITSAADGLCCGETCSNRQHSEAKSSGGRAKVTRD